MIHRTPGPGPGARGARGLTWNSSLHPFHRALRQTLGDVQRPGRRPAPWATLSGITALEHTAPPPPLLPRLRGTHRPWPCALPPTCPRPGPLRLHRRSNPFSSRQTGFHPPSRALHDAPPFLPSPHEPPSHEPPSHEPPSLELPLSSPLPAQAPRSTTRCPRGPFLRPRKTDREFRLIEIFRQTTKNKKQEQNTTPKTSSVSLLCETSPGGGSRRVRRPAPGHEAKG